MEACPGNLIKRGQDGKAFLRHPEECWGCTSCLKECRFDAIRFFLGADIGGRGSLMHTVQEGPLTHWIIERSNQDDIVITVDKRNSNQY